MHLLEDNVLLFENCRDIFALQCNKHQIFLKLRTQILMFLYQNKNHRHSAKRQHLIWPSGSDSNTIDQAFIFHQSDRSDTYRYMKIRYFDLPSKQNTVSMQIHSLLSKALLKLFQLWQQLRSLVYIQVSQFLLTSLKWILKNLSGL